MGKPETAITSGCYAVIFTSKLKPDADIAAYENMADEMVASCHEQPGFLGLESARDEDGTGITVCYWQREADIAHWRETPRHLEAQAQGKAEWYETYSVTIARVERAYGNNPQD